MTSQNPINNSLMTHNMKPSQKPSHQTLSVPSQKPAVSPASMSPISLPMQTAMPSTMPSDVVTCPPAYAVGMSYVAYSQVEVDGIIFSCNPYPFTIYCAQPDFKPFSTIHDLWKDVWTELSKCVQAPTDMPSVQPSNAPTFHPTTRQTKKTTSKPITLEPSQSPSDVASTVRPSPSNSEVDTIANSPSPFPSASLEFTFLPTAPSQPAYSSDDTTIVVDVETDVNVELKNMTHPLSDDGVTVFEETFIEFLNDELAITENLFHIKSCTVIKQELMYGRRSLRQLEGSSSVIVTTRMAYSKEDNDPTDLVQLLVGAVEVDYDAITSLLKSNGEEAGIDDFSSLDGIDSITAIDQNDGIPESVVIEGDENKKNKVIATGIIIGGFAVLLFFGALLYQVRKGCRNESLFSVSTSDDEYDKNPLSELEPNSIYLQTYQQGSAENDVPSQDTTDPFIDYVLNDIRTQHHGGQVKSQNGVFYLSGSGSNYPVRVRREVMAPPGKLGIIIQSSKQGPVVHLVKPESVLKGLLFDGDLIIALDNDDTTAWNAHTITRVISQRSKLYRKITVLGKVNMQC